jgi:hypothetical protein
MERNIRERFGRLLRGLEATWNKFFTLNSSIQLPELRTEAPLVTRNSGFLDI